MITGQLTIHGVGPSPSDFGGYFPILREEYGGTGQSLRQEEGCVIKCKPPVRQIEEARTSRSRTLFSVVERPSFTQNMEVQGWLLRYDCSPGQGHSWRSGLGKSNDPLHSDSNAHYLPLLLPEKLLQVNKTIITLL